MLRLLGSALLATGGVLLWLGLDASSSFASGVTRLFSGSPTKESVMLLSAGAALIAVGLLLFIARRKGRRRWR